MKSIIFLLLIAGCGSQMHKNYLCITKGQACPTREVEDTPPPPETRTVYVPVPGPQGVPGKNGASCTVQQVSTGSVILCPDGSIGHIYNGKDGGSCGTVQVAEGAIIACDNGTSSVVLNGVNSVASGAYSIQTVFHLCGKDDAAIRLTDSTVLAFYWDSGKYHFAALKPGVYRTFNGKDSCEYTVHESGEITW